MSKYSKEDIIRLVKEEDVEFIRMQFTDIFGQLKNVAITASQLEKALNNQIMIDGSSIEGFTRIHESDQYLRPDLDSFTLLPWRPQSGGVARFICDVYNPDGTPFIGDPRHVLKIALDRAAKMGYTFNVGPECEFFFFETDEAGRPTTKTGDEAGYFDLSPIDHGEATRREICLALEDMGFEIEASHHEVAEGQHEINFKYADALTAADNTVTFKWVVRSIAAEFGLHATFMPKPVFGINGSGMHTNQSLFNLDGTNAFYDEKGPLELSPVAYKYIAGIMKNAKGFCAVTNPLVNSYKRLVAGYEAPVYVAWSASNRSALVRIPASRGMGTRTEVRCPDPACNPYLAFAMMLGAGLDGIKNDLPVPDAVNADIFEMTAAEKKEAGIASLPANLYEAVQELKASPIALDALGPHILAKYIEGKEKEWDSFRIAITDWEHNTYLSRY